MNQGFESLDHIATRHLGSQGERECEKILLGLEYRLHFPVSHHPQQQHHPIEALTLRALYPQGLQHVLSPSPQGSVASLMLDFLRDMLQKD